jgi:hypothetical protein
LPLTKIVYSVCWTLYRTGASLGNYQLIVVRRKLFTSDLNPVAKQTVFRYTDYVVDYCVWMDEYLTFNKSSKELAKFASRELGSLMSKVVATGGMTRRVYTKLYISTVEPILMYGSDIWGTEQFSCISSVQNRACKFFLSVEKHTLNIAARGDMGWTSCFTKQRVNLCRLWYRFLRTDESRNSYKIL